tara:strand:- start:140 stop:1243 length:1104 start_codon:yes stop_codon:yes gene_type:complete
MKAIYQITIAHSRYDSRIFQRIANSLAKANLDITLIVCDGLGDEKIGNLYIRDLGNTKFFLLGHIIKQLKIFIELKNVYSILHFHEPILLPLAIILRLFRNIVVFDMHENLHLQIITKTWRIPKYLKLIISRIYRIFEDILLRIINGITVPQPIMVEMYKKQNNNIISVSNFFIDIEDISYDDLIKEKDFKNLIYSGTISNERGFKNMINLINKMPKGYKLNIAGEINYDFKRTIPENLKDRVILHGLLNLTDLRKLYLKCGIGLIMFNNIGQYYMSYSLKLFEYMHFGMFIIMPNFGEWNKFNNKYKVGINVDTKDSNSTAQKIKNLDFNYLKTISSKNYSDVRKYFIWENEVNKLIDFYKRISDS